MKYRELKDQRDDAIARMLEAERLSMKSEFDRVQAEADAERERLIQQAEAEVAKAYKRGYREGVKTLADHVSKMMDRVVDECCAGDP